MVPYYLNDGGPGPKSPTLICDLVPQYLNIFFRDLGAPAFSRLWATPRNPGPLKSRARGSHPPYPPLSPALVVMVFYILVLFDKPKNPISFFAKNRNRLCIQNVSDMLQFSA